MDDEELFDDFPDDLLLNALDNVENSAQKQQQPIQKPSKELKVKKHRQLTLFETKIKPTLNLRGVHDFADNSAADAKIIVDDSGKCEKELSVSANLACFHRYDPAKVGCWLYPTNYPVRMYQFKIVRRALFENTLVCLPTGLGKTFIAAVVMYNYWRWFPQGKIVFMAPTKPLVSQQITACYNITGLPAEQTVEITGQHSPTLREQMWREKRVFFLTPQVLQNDLQRGTCDPRDLVCIVVDEAHRSTGNYAYCEVVRDVYNQNQECRILALSATPGSDIKAVQQVVTNLRISHIEIRTEESIEVQEYTHTRQKQVITVRMSPEIASIRDEYLQHVVKVFVDRLFRRGAFYQRDVALISKYQLLTSRNQWRQRRPPTMDQKEKSMIEGDFAVLISLYHAYELLLKHGLVPFFRYLSEFVDPNGGQKMTYAKKSLVGNPRFQGILTRITSAQQAPTFSGHPKLEHLENIVLEHFTNHPTAEQNGIAQTRVMIFSEFRDSVDEIVARLNKHEPLLRVISFVGQASKNGKGLAQKEQLEVIRKFQSGNYNVLVATSIGEEGLDIGEVDLIICFDSQSSPVRMLQRMGRTGRKRDGRIVVLVSEGKEEQQYRKTHDQYKTIQNAIMNQSRMFQLWEPNPRVIPEDMPEPICIQTKLTIPEHVSNNTKPTTSNRAKKASLPRRHSSLGGCPYPDLFTAEEWNEYQRTAQLHSTLEVPDLKLTARLAKQKEEHPTHLVQHSSTTKLFAESISLISMFKHMKSSKQEHARWEQSLLRKLNPEMLDESCRRGLESADDSVVHLADETITVDMVEPEMDHEQNSSPLLPTFGDVLARTSSRPVTPFIAPSPQPVVPIVEEYEGLYSNKAESDIEVATNSDTTPELITPTRTKSISSLLRQYRMCHEFKLRYPDKELHVDPVHEIKSSQFRIDPLPDIKSPLPPPVTPLVKDDFGFDDEDDSILLDVDLEGISRSASVSRATTRPNPNLPKSNEHSFPS